MITEIIIKLFVLINVVSFIQIAYNALIYRQRGKMKWAKFSAITVPVLIIGYLLFSYVKAFTEIKYINFIVESIDSIIFTFFGYLPKELLLLWFIVPLIIVWISYIVLTLFKVLKNRYKYMQWKNRVENEEGALTKENKNKELAIEESEDKIQDIELMEDKSLIKTQDIDLQNNAIQAQPIHFLGEATTQIRYKSVLGLQRAYEVAKAKGLQLTETETGYAAVYADKTGVEKLKNLFVENGIDPGGLKNRPSLVFFDLNTVQCVSIKEALEKMKNGGEALVK